MGLTSLLFGTPGEKQTAVDKFLRNPLKATKPNKELFKKAYMIEFYGNDDKTPEDVFTFSMPPESEELSYTQRKT